MTHTISVLVENHFGVLTRVSGLFSARGFNIDSLAVGETADPAISRMTIVAHGDDRVLAQIIKQLDKLVDVIRIEHLAPADSIERELVLAKVMAPTDVRSEVMQVVNTFRAKIVDVNLETLTVEVTGGESKIDAMLALLKPFGILEVVRTGLIAISRSGVLSAGQAEIASEEKKPRKSSKKKAAARRKKTAKKK